MDSLSYAANGVEGHQNFTQINTELLIPAKDVAADFGLPFVIMAHTIPANVFQGRGAAAQVRYVLAMLASHTHSLNTDDCQSVKPQPPL